jgi:hypothetical protein
VTKIPATLPQIPLTFTPQNIQDRKRVEVLMEIEEDQKDIPKKLRKLIETQPDLKHLSALTMQINRKYAAGELSDKLLNRCGTWVSRRVAELKPPKETH